MKPPAFDPKWPAEVHALYNHDVQEMWDRTVAPHVWNQYHNQLRVYSAFAGSTPLDILDVGCAQATLALILAERGHRVCAMDIREPFLDYARSRYEKGDIQFVCGNALEISPNRSFDLIYANQILEHLVYPKTFISRLASWLNPGGRIIITTPNGHYFVNDLPAFAEIVPEHHAHSQYSADADGHFFAYRAAELTNIVAACGLTDVTVEYFETPWISGHVKIRYLHRWVAPGVLRALDKISLAIPGLSKRVAHQLMIRATKPVQ